MTRSIQRHRKRNKSSKKAMLAWARRRAESVPPLCLENSDGNKQHVMADAKSDADAGLNPLSERADCHEHSVEDENLHADGKPHVADQLSESSEWDADVCSMRIPTWCSTKYVPRHPKQSGVISSDECERIMAHELDCEVEARPESLITGNRIVELGYVLDWAISLQYNHSKICTMGVLSVKGESRKGLTSTVEFVCNACDRILSFNTENPKREKSVINVGAVWGTLASGSTYSHMSELLSCMDVPTMSPRLFHDLENQLGKEWNASLLSSMKSAGVIERETAIQNKQLCSDGTPWITVYVDGSWSKRSYGTNFNSLSGMIGIIGKHTGEVLFVGVRNKYCTICAKFESSGKPVKNHVCYKNWDGSASAMEADMVVDGFNQSEAMHGVRYLKFVGDGDSSVFSKIQNMVTYGKEVRKLECTNHALKNYGKRLRTIKGDAQINLKGRKLLTNLKIKALSKRAKCSIYEHAKNTTPNVDLLRYDLRNGLHHVFGDHASCRDGICNTVGDTTKSTIPELKSTTIYNHLNGALDLLVRKAHLLIENENNNRAERLMNIVSRFNEGKRLNLIQRGSYQRRVHLSGLRYNKRFNWHYDPYKNFMSASPGKHFKNFIAKNYRQQEAKCRRRLLSSDDADNNMPNKKRKTNSNLKRMEVNTEYGPHADQQMVDEKLLAEEVDIILGRLQISETERDRIEIESIGQFGNDIFESESKLRLTASLFGKVIKRRPYTSCHNMVKECLKSCQFWSEATDYGIAKEKVAIGIFEELKKLQVRDSGFWIDLQYGFLGASPDGIVVGEDSIVEVKCIYSASKLELKTQTLEEVIDIMKSRICLEKFNDQIRLKRNHNYYYQVQGQLNITQKSKCYFIIYINDVINLFVEEIERDVKLWEEKMCPNLIRFYKECIAPEIVIDNLGKGRRCVDPPFILEAISIQEANKKQKSKAIPREIEILEDENVHALKPVIVPIKVITLFQEMAENNTKINIESCGILTGRLENNELKITHLILPKQRGTSDSCIALHEEEILEYQQQNDLLTIGWIHTHPSQTSFLSSVDLHTHCSYQILMSEAIAIVCAPKYKQIGYYNLNTSSIDTISKCKKSGFHPHPNEPHFKEAEHVKIDNNATLEVVDLRNA